MLRTSILLVAILSLAALASADSVFPYKYEETNLDNGLKVITIPMKNTGLVSYFTIVRAGSRDEIEPGKSGFAHFFEHMMYHGTDKYPPEKYNAAVTEMGADANASTYDDRTVYYIHFPTRYLERVVDLESDRFQNLKYPKAAFQTEAKAVLGEYNKNFANPFFQTAQKLRETAFDKSTYKHTAMGFIKDIEDMPNQYDYSLQFFDRFYRPENCTILITGEFNPQEAVALVKKYYSGWKRGDYKTVNPVDPPQTAERTAKIDYSGDTLPILAMGYKATAYNPSDREFAALWLMGPLAFGETSELYQQLVLKDQTVDLLAPDFDPHRDPCLFGIYARLKKADDLPKVQQSIEAALEKMKTTPVSEKRLADLKSNIKYGFLLSLDTSKNTAFQVAPYINLSGDIASLDVLFKTFDSITADDVRNIAQKYFAPEKRTVVTLTGGK